MSYNLSAIFIAYLLDLILGDPQWQSHPVRIIGRLIAKLEKKLNTPSGNKIFCGVILVFIVAGAAFVVVWGSLKLAGLLHPVFHFLLSLLFIYFGLSVKDLAVEANKVKLALARKDILQARKNLSLIVGRDTDKLDEPEIIRAAVETVAESIMDGIVAPLCYCFLGGPALMWLYKAVNTLDSMVGYRSVRFMEFGKAAAKLDGILNFIPARITSFLIGIAGLGCRKDKFGAFKWGFRYFFKAPEFNSQMTESAMAGALGVKLGGINFYNSIAIPKPLMGDNLEPLEIKHIQESIKISYLCSVLAVILGIIIYQCQTLRLLLSPLSV